MTVRRTEESFRSEDSVQPDPVYAAIEATETSESQNVASSETLTANAAYSQIRPAQEQQTELNETGS